MDRRSIGNRAEINGSLLNRLEPPCEFDIWSDKNSERVSELQGHTRATVDGVRTIAIVSDDARAAEYNESIISRISQPLERQRIDKGNDTLVLERSLLTLGLAMTAVKRMKEGVRSYKISHSGAVYALFLYKKVTTSTRY